MAHSSGLRVGLLVTICLAHLTTPRASTLSTYYSPLTKSFPECVFRRGKDSTRAAGLRNFFAGLGLCYL